MANRVGNWWVGLLVAFATGCTGNDPYTEALGNEEQANDTPYDRPALAAFEATVLGGVHIPILVACDENNRLKYAYRHLTDGWLPWTEIASGCVGVPAVAKWRNEGHDSAAIYARFDDNHLWEAWLPNLNNRMDNFSWTDISVASGLGDVTDSPMLAASGFAWDVSVAVKRGTSALKSLYTVDWVGGTWDYHKVYSTSTGSTAISTENVVSTRGPLDVDNAGYSYIAGRGLADDTTGWFARRKGSRAGMSPRELVGRHSAIASRLGALASRRSPTALPPSTASNEAARAPA